MSKWKCVGVDGIDSVPQRPGVYVVYKHLELMYVGQSINLWKRLVAHRAAAYKRTSRNSPLGLVGMDGLKFKYRLYPERSGEWLSSEYRLVSRLKPPLNSVSGDRIRRQLEAANRREYYHPDKTVLSKNTRRDARSKPAALCTPASLLTEDYVRGVCESWKNKVDANILAPFTT
jgi:excinuclease UvrABC nuclease subunit